MIDSSRKNFVVNKKNIQAHSLYYFWTLYLSIYFADNSFFKGQQDYKKVMYWVMSQKIPDTPKIFYNGRRPSVDPLSCTSFR